MKMNKKSRQSESSGDESSGRMSESSIELSSGTLRASSTSDRSVVSGKSLDLPERSLSKSQMEPVNETTYTREKRTRVSLNQPPHTRLTQLLHTGCKLEFGLYFKPDELHKVIDDAKKSLMTRRMLDEVTSPVIIIGDIHGCYRTLFNIFELFGWPGVTNHLFLGDYVDRGKHSLEVITLLLCSQIVFPNNFHLLRGNHETAKVNGIYGFKKELCEVYDEEEGIKLWDHFNEAFNCMPICGLVNGKVLCMHGGLSPELKNLEQIRKIQRPLVPNPKTSPLAHDLMWADPYKADCSKTYTEYQGKVAQEGPSEIEDKKTSKGGLCGCCKSKKAQKKGEQENRFTENKKRCTSWLFNEGALDASIQQLGIDMVVRGHEVRPYGYGLFGKKRLLTIFSRANYDTSHNYGAIAQIDANNQATVHVMRPKDIVGYPIVQRNRPPSTHFSDKSG